MKAVTYQMLGFALTGTLSTLLMFGPYVALEQFIHYQYAYLISYILSVVALYFMNSMVFKAKLSLHNSFAFPLIYLMQYVVGALSLEFLIRLGVPVTYAPVLVIILLLPITFVLNKIVFSKY